MKTLDKMFKEGSIPMYYKQFFPIELKCSCGSELVANQTLTRVLCPNKNCSLKLAARLDNVLTAMNIKGYSRDGLLKYVAGLKMEELLLTAISENPTGPFLEIKKWLRNNNHTLREVVTAMQLPKYPTEIGRVFKGYKDIQAFVGDLSLTTYEEFVARKLLKRVTDQTQEMAAILSAHTNEIIRICLFSNLRGFVKEYDIIITGNIRPIKFQDKVYQTKYDFIQLCNIIGNGKVSVASTTRYSEVDYIINDNANSNTEKYRKGQEFGNLKTSEEFIKIVEREVSKYAGK